MTTSSSLMALNRAVLALSRDLGLDEVLRTILRTAQQLAQARDAALGIPDGHGGFGTFLTAGISEARARRRIGTLPRADGVLGLVLCTGRLHPA